MKESKGLVSKLNLFKKYFFIKEGNSLITKIIAGFIKFCRPIQGNIKISR